MSGLGVIDDLRPVLTLRSRGYIPRSPQAPKEAAGIASFDRPGWQTDEINRRLMAHGIVVSVREGAVRVSAHAFNTPDEIDALITNDPAALIKERRKSSEPVD